MNEVPIEKVKEIINKAINIERWAPKTTDTYPFIDDEERVEMTENIIRELKKSGYKIVLNKEESSIH
tara:strand:+ start:348 stop:548 length:201 start_codon:yes stop_codon:yes gene_type:complete